MKQGKEERKIREENLEIIAKKGRGREAIQKRQTMARKEGTVEAEGRKERAPKLTTTERKRRKNEEMGSRVKKKRGEGKR